MIPNDFWMIFIRVVNGHIVGVPNYPMSRTKHQSVEGLDIEDGKFLSFQDFFYLLVWSQENNIYFQAVVWLFAMFYFYVSGIFDKQ